MLLGAIDIGSNAVRLFFSNVFEQDGKIMVEKASLMRIPLRLGDDVFLHNLISETKIRKLVKTMKAFRLLIEVNEPAAYRACATSAMREASNGDEIVNIIMKEAGIDVRIINGLEEAQILSAVHNVDISSNYLYSLYIDVGGGSTEISLISKKGIVTSESFEIGTVRMISNRVRSEEWTRMRNWLLQYRECFPRMLSVGAGGNINKLARLYGRMPEKTLPFTNLEYGLKNLQSFTLQQRIDIMGLRPDRADVIIPAAQIFHFIMKLTQGQTLLVPRMGLSDGIVNVLYKEITRSSLVNKA
jgi:exopolyphosphatase / guanosine-5'-triphosphate,3'-diphosphate pyrophosphatase